MTLAMTKTSDFCSGDPSASLRMTGLCAKTTLSSRPEWRDLMTLAMTKTSVFLFRRSFGFAQDDRLVCQGDSLQCCYPA